MDRWHFRIQCLTLEKYMEPCELHVVVNEAYPRSWLNWFDVNLKRHIRKHVVHVYIGEHFFDDRTFIRLEDAFTGWVTQQVFKLAFSLVTDRPYLVLDSKNWLIKPTIYDDISGKRKRSNASAIYTEMIESAIEIFKLGTDITYCHEITPFEMNPEITLQMFDTFGGLAGFVEWFTSFPYQSEFVVYNLFAQSIGRREAIDGYRATPCLNYWLRGKNEEKMTEIDNMFLSEDAIDLDKVREVLKHPHIKMLSIHRRLLDHGPIADEIELMVKSLG